LNQILLERFDSEGVFDFEDAGRSARPVGLDQEFAILAEEARVHLKIVEACVIEVAENGFVVGMGHRVAMLRTAPESCLWLVAARTDLAADKCRCNWSVTVDVRRGNIGGVEA